MENLYTLLEIDDFADSKTIKKAYRKLALIYHPDRNPSCPEKFLLINNAYEVLANPTLKEKYDKQLRNFQTQSKLNNFPHKNSSIGIFHKFDWQNFLYMCLFLIIGAYILTKILSLTSHTSNSTTKIKTEITDKESKKIEDLLKFEEEKEQQTGNINF